MKSLYFLIDFFTVIVPLIFSFHPKIKFYKTWKQVAIAAILAGIIFITWDSIFIRLGVWSFNPRYVSGIFFFNLPVEEMLFFICIPFSCVFTYYCLTKFYNLAWNPKTENIFCIVFSILLLATGILFRDKLYTSVTFISTGIVCLLLKFVFKADWFGKAISVYALLLVPFLLVNGILTGTGLEEPVVIYNKTQNLDIRLFTIPLEDVFYGLELFVLNLFVYLKLSEIELQKKKSSDEKDSINTKKPDYEKDFANS
ncbi:MAG TPA: lycopene cyclase domain-containing protein [Hanamia sp.]|jgi:lycopene cyclase domain-containing protein|nr:lycopene cyclase domain-containing protein [Hanamia sp.]